LNPQIKKNFNSFSNAGSSICSPGKNPENPDSAGDGNSTNNNNNNNNNNNKASEAVRISLR
jgi:hypothetical protein